MVHLGAKYKSCTGVMQTPAADPCPPPHPQFPAAISTLPAFADKNLEQRLKEIDEECKKKESRRVDLELSLVEVKENLKKAESGPVTLGTTVDTTHLENTAPRVGFKVNISLENNWVVSVELYYTIVLKKATISLHGMK